MLPWHQLNVVRQNQIYYTYSGVPFVKGMSTFTDTGDGTVDLSVRSLNQFGSEVEQIFGRRGFQRLNVNVTDVLLVNRCLGMPRLRLVCLVV